MFTTDRIKKINTLSFLCILLTCLLIIINKQDVVAQENRAADEITMDQINIVASELWCPLCSGVRLDTCELKACEQMKEEIAIQLADGKDTEFIKAYFLDQYGPQILGEPPRSGFNWLAWITPFALLGVSGLLLVLRWRSTPIRETEPTQVVAQAGDPYGEILDQELRRYE